MNAKKSNFRDFGAFKSPKKRLFQHRLITSNQAGATFARFLHGWDIEKTQELHQWLEIEKQNDSECIWAEAFFIPDSSRTLNVMLHPPLKEFSISFHFHNPDERTFSIADIYVGADPQELFLYVPKFQKRVKINLSSAVNPDLAPPLLKFLLDISNAKKNTFMPLLWAPLKDLMFIPRFRYKNIIICPARWHFSLDSFNKDEQKDLDSLKKALEKKFDELKVPQIVSLTEHDHRLRIDRSIQEHFDLLLNHLKSKKMLTLFEIPFSETPSPVTSEVGEHVTEFVVPFIKVATDKIGNPPQIPDLSPAIHQRFFLPGDKCFYFQINTSKWEEERFLRENLFIWINSLKNFISIDRWFYIRYQDATGDHIRCRIFSSKQQIYTQILPFIYDKIKPLHLVGSTGNFSILTYERETERYGGEGAIESAEDLFCADSECCALLLQWRHSYLEKCPLYIVAALGIIHLVFNFYSDWPTLSKRLHFWRDQHANLLKGCRETIRDLLPYAFKLFRSEESFDQNGSYPPFEIYQTRDQALKAYARIVKSQHINSEKLFSIISSLCHMHCNRLIGISTHDENKAHALAAYLMIKVLDKMRSLK